MSLPINPLVLVRGLATKSAARSFSPLDFLIFFISALLTPRSLRMRISLASLVLCVISNPFLPILASKSPSNRKKSRSFLVISRGLLSTLSRAAANCSGVIASRTDLVTPRSLSICFVSPSNLFVLPDSRFRVNICSALLFSIPNALIASAIVADLSPIFLPINF